jgi:hypothetical protein
LAISESDPDKVIGRIEYALIAIERRYSEWGTNPGTSAELKAIQKCIAALQRRTKQKQLRKNLAIVATAQAEPQKRRELSVSQDRTIHA